MAFKRLTPTAQCPNPIRIAKSTTTQSIGQWALVYAKITTGSPKCLLVTSKTNATVTNFLGVAENRSKSGSAEPISVMLSESVEYEVDLITATTLGPGSPLSLSQTTTKAPSQYLQKGTGGIAKATTTDAKRFGYATRAITSASVVRMRFFPPSGLYTR